MYISWPRYLFTYIYSCICFTCTLIFKVHHNLEYLLSWLEIVNITNDSFNLICCHGNCCLSNLCLCLFVSCWLNTISWRYSDRNSSLQIGQIFNCTLYRIWFWSKIHYSTCALGYLHPRKLVLSCIHTVQCICT